MYQTHVQHLRQTAMNDLEQFQENCCNKCRPRSESQSDLIVSSSPVNDMPYHNSPLTISDSPTGSSHDPPDPGHTMMNGANSYLLNDFQAGMLASNASIYLLLALILLDLLQFVKRLEDSLKSHINTIEFAHITGAIPLQEFGQNEAMLATLSHGLLHYKIKGEEQGLV